MIIKINHKNLKELEKDLVIVLKKEWKRLIKNQKIIIKINHKNLKEIEKDRVIV